MPEHITARPDLTFGLPRDQVYVLCFSTTMAASAADIRSALSLPEANALAGPSQQKKLITTRKPEGISRELYSLIGPSAPSLTAQLSKPRLKQKPNFGVGGVKTKWLARSNTSTRSS